MGVPTGSLSGVKPAIDAVRALGFEPVFAFTNAFVRSYFGQNSDWIYQELVRLNITVYAADTIEDIIHYVTPITPMIAGVMSFNDLRLFHACHIAHILQVPGPEHEVILLKDKGKVAAAIPEYSPDTLTFLRSEANSPATQKHLQAFHQKHPELMFKPALSTGSEGNFISESPDFIGNLSEAIDDHAKEMDFIDDEHWLAQQCIKNPYIYSVEGYVCQSAVHILGFSHREETGLVKGKPNNMIASSVFIPSLSIRQTVQEAIARLFNRMDYTNGYFHIEYIDKDGKIYIIDANCGRLGGQCVVPVLATAYGIESQTIYEHNIGLTLFPESPQLISPFAEKADAPNLFQTLEDHHSSGQLMRECIDQPLFFHTRGTVNYVKPLIQHIRGEEWSCHIQSTYDVDDTLRLSIDNSLYLTAEQSWERLFICNYSAFVSVS